MNKNIKILIGVLITVAIVAAMGFTIKAGLDKMATEKRQNKVLATVNGENITQKDFDITKENIIISDMKMGDQEILSRLTVQKVRYLNALQSKVQVKEEDIKKLVADKKSKIVKAGKYETLKSDLKKLKISEKDYWDSETKILREDAISDEFKLILKTKFLKTLGADEEANGEAKFNEVYNKVMSDAIAAADIKILVELK